VKNPHYTNCAGRGQTEVYVHLPLQDLLPMRVPNGHRFRLRQHLLEFPDQFLQILSA
jgi:hypothetical protein